jgi:diaminohydroxyphosphoribosylaminopyrimidine deaminase / 5-amino-6-(5-phosphoribosylamino)uracil reductase
MPELSIDERWMRVALTEAARGLGRCSPNPAVGAAIVRDGDLKATGYHRQAGQPHAEIEALRALAHSDDARNATIYVTLEPCSTTGRTPPCTDAIIAAGFRRVVVGAVDPNPVHQGRGLQQLKQAGIEVTAGVLETECRDLNVGFNRWITSRMPWVIVKFAQSLDGRITRRPDENQTITGPAAKHRVQELRATVDAILVGAETVRTDNPRLTVRGIPDARQPWRVIVTRTGDLPKNAHVFTDEHKDRTVVSQSQPWRGVFAELGRREITRCLVEGGSNVLGQLLDEGWIDEVWSFTAPILVGGDKPSIGGSGVQSNETAFRIANPQFEQLDSDILVHGFVSPPGNARSQNSVVSSQNTQRSTQSLLASDF